MQVTHLRQALIGAAAVLAALPALAGTVFPGSLCTSDGPAERSLNGLMLNKATGLAANRTPGTTAFYCTIIHSRAGTNIAGQFTVKVNVKTSNANVEFSCFIRSVSSSNVAYDTLKLSFGTTYFQGDYQSLDNQVSLPAFYQPSVNMRCLVPNLFQGSEAGIVSYSVQ